MTYYDLKYLEPEEFKNKFEIEPFNKISGMPSYYTILDGKIKVWPSIYKNNPLPKLAWRF